MVAAVIIYKIHDIYMFKIIIAISAISFFVLQLLSKLSLLEKIFSSH